MSLTGRRWGWAMYDWANSAFATTVMAGFFPVFFKHYWNAGVPVTDPGEPGRGISLLTAGSGARQGSTGQAGWSGRVTPQGGLRG
jgi:MFS-type transporter involved in bile tolerance (Atg22 family)